MSILIFVPNYRKLFSTCYFCSRQLAIIKSFKNCYVELLHTSTEMLGMNQNEEYRMTQEERLFDNIYFLTKAFYVQ